MRGFIAVNAYSALKSAMNQPTRLKQELEKLGIETDIIRLDSFPVYIDGCDIINRVSAYDFCVYLDKDKYISAMLEKTGMRLFNTHEAIRICDDKYDTFIRLSGNNIRMPLTLPGLLCYSGTERVKLQTVESVIEKTGLPVIVKYCYGSLGEGVYLIKDREELLQTAERIKLSPHLFQQYISSSCGRDVRVIVIAGKAVAAMKRESKTDFRSNIELGGSGEPFELPDSFRAISEKTAQLIGLDYCGIDLLFAQDGEPVLCEVNSNAFFAGIEAVTGTNIAMLYARHIRDTMQSEKGRL